MLSAEVERYYLEAFGSPSRRAIFREGQTRVLILKWDAATHPEGVALYATVGASELPAAGTPEHRSEFFVGLLPERDQIATALATLVWQHAHQRIEVSPGDTFSLDEPLWPGTDMTCLWVVRPREMILAPMVGSEAHVEFVQLIPLFASERHAIRAVGAEAFLAAWESEAVPFWDPERSATA